jgi:hypothetical protein
MRSARAALVVTLAAALAFRLMMALVLATDEPDDGRLYALIAHNILSSHVYSQSESPPVTPTYIRVPGYPLFIAAAYRLFGDRNNTGVRMVQACVDTATCWLIGVLASAWTPRVWGDRPRRRVRLLAVGIAAVCPFTAIYVGTILTETLAMFLGTVTALAATYGLHSLEQSDATAPQSDRERTAVSASARDIPTRHPAVPWIAAGAAGGATALVRPEFILYVAAVWAAALVVTAPGLRLHAGNVARWARRVVRPSLALCAGAVLVLTPWTVRNLRTFGVLEVLNPRSVSMPDEFVAYGFGDWVRTWIDHPRYVPTTLWKVDLEPIRIEDLPPTAFDSERERDRVVQLLAQYNKPPADAEPEPETGEMPPGGMTPAMDASFAEIAHERIARNPLRYYVVLPLERAASMWFDTHADFYPFSGFLFPLADLDQDRQQQFWLPLFAVLVAAWTLGVSIGAWCLAQHDDTRGPLVLAALMILLRLGLLSWLENPEVRYTVEFFPIVSALASIGFIWLFTVRGSATDRLPLTTSSTVRLTSPPGRER